MQLKKKHGAISSVAFLNFMLVLMLTGCNDDVFVARPDFGSHTLRVGETINVKLPQNLDMGDVWLYVSCGDDFVLYEGNPNGFSSKLIGIHYSLDAGGTVANVSVDFNYFPEPVDFRIGVFGWDDKMDIKVLPESTQKYTPGKIEYNLMRWTYDTEIRQYQGGVRENNSSEPVEIEISPVIPYKMCACFRPEDDGAFILFAEKDFLLPALAVDSNGFPVETGEKIPFSSYYTSIPGYQLECDEPYRYTLAPGQKVSCLVSVENRRYYLDYILEAVNADGVTLNLPGKLEIVVPQRYIYEVKPR